MDQQELKLQVGNAVLDYIKPGMTLGIGTGSTAEAFVKALAKKVAEGLNVIGVPTSERTRMLCEQLGVPLTTLDETPQLDLTIDGADEIDPALNLIKGGGGALLREKIVAAASKEMLVIADESKLVKHLGAFPLPIEVNRFGLAATRAMIKQVAEAAGLSGPMDVRAGKDGEPFVTDSGHLIIDASFGRIDDPVSLAVSLNAIPGVVEHGIFSKLATRAIIAASNGILVVEPV